MEEALDAAERDVLGHGGSGGGTGEAPAAERGNKSLGGCLDNMMLERNKSGGGHGCC